MNNARDIISYIILAIVVYLVNAYSLDVKLLYPEWILDFYLEPFNKFLLYLALFVIGNISKTYGILYFVFIIFAHIDVLQYMK